MCSSPEVVLAFLLYEGSTIHSASDQLISYVYFFLVDFAFHPSPQTKIGSIRANFKQLYLDTYWKLDTCLYKLIYSEQSILPPPKIFTIPFETRCVWKLYVHFSATAVADLGTSGSYLATSRLLSLAVTTKSLLPAFLLILISVTFWHLNKFFFFQSCNRKFLISSPSCSDTEPIICCLPYNY